MGWVYPFRAASKLLQSAFGHCGRGKSESIPTRISVSRRWNFSRLVSGPGGFSGKTAEEPKVSVDDMLAIQKDVYAAYDSFLAHRVIEICNRRPESNVLVREALEVLRKWNGQMDKGEAAPMITQLLSAQLANSLVANLLPAGSTLPGPAGPIDRFALEDFAPSGSHRRAFANKAEWLDSRKRLGHVVNCKSRQSSAGRKKAAGYARAPSGDGGECSSGTLHIL